jgi:hypothetical protein
MTKMLNFSYVHALVPKMQTIVKKSLANIEKEVILG